MANKIMILGDSGTGKTTSLETLDPKETFIICSDEKSLPFKGWKKRYQTTFSNTGKLDLQNTNLFNTTDVKTIKVLLEKISSDMPHIKIIIIDTITNLMIAEYMRRIKEKGLKYTGSFKTSLTAGTHLETIIPFIHSDIVYSLTVTGKAW